MKQRIKWREKLTQGWSAGVEPLTKQPILEFCGEGRLLIENHKGVIEYGTERIGVNVGYGQIVISGEGLRLCRMQGEQLVILGQVDQIALLRRKP
ncbi:MAG: YabP/YqfC family sporulation protein [Oscillospiraceae bacterium]|nr:YabP/YqfC family sporulation protein [Oscillospiraceae bacterium]